MSREDKAKTKTIAGSGIGFFESYLTIWVGICIVVGIGAGHFAPAPFHAIAAMEYAQVNIPVALLIWVMIIPMLLKVDFHALKSVAAYWPGVSVTLFVNWGVKPFSMALLAWIFIDSLFRPWLPADQINSYVAGLIILAAAPCTAMVFVWSNLSEGEPNFTLTQVALNDMIMIFAFAPIVGLLLGLSSITVPWDTLLLSVVLYIVVPLILANIWRARLLKGNAGKERFELTLRVLHPLSLGALLLMLVLLFGFQGEQILRQPIVIVLLAVPILIQVFFNSGLAYLVNRAVRSPHCVAGPSALIGASNFFELAVAVAISLFGFESGAALATVVGVLIEVPVMLAAVALVNRTRGWYERRGGVVPHEECCPSAMNLRTNP
ncbi:MAG: ACR3 family arsenite efflux transporter [Nitrospinota bacterium]